jgi:hypothetical protein
MYSTTEKSASATTSQPADRRRRDERRGSQPSFLSPANRAAQENGHAKPTLLAYLVAVKTVLRETRITARGRNGAQ